MSAGGWTVPSLPRIGRPYTAHYTSGPGRIDGLERVLCDDYLTVCKGIPARAEHPRCTTCAERVPAGIPVQLDMLEYLEATV